MGIGASAGGLEAFTQLIKQLPADTGMSFVLVQHLDPTHESALTQILSRETLLPVEEITDGQKAEPDHIYVIPPNTSLRIMSGILHLEPRQKIHAPHRPIDTFFESLAQDQHDCAIGVVLSGTASDGTLGLEAIKAEGGITFAQDDSARHNSMPRSAVTAGCVDMVLSPAGIAHELTRIARHPYLVKQRLEHSVSGKDSEAGDHAEALSQPGDDKPAGNEGAPADTKNEDYPQDAQSSYKEILFLLRNHSGVDFSLYKSTTIRRRINRRLVLSKQSTLAEYARSLRGNIQELDMLYSDVLISVTSFFRNPEIFDALQRDVLPNLLKQRGDDPLRCWVLGCSTGQEAYSIAMAFVETAEKALRARKLQIFATDLNEAVLEKARHGLYAKSIDQDISPERLKRFFVEEEGGYRISKALREMVVFARQNIIIDPPFSRMDLISCRNLMIYLEPSLQKKLIPTFHYALKAGGFLILGASESISGFTDLFEPIDKKHKIFARKTVSTPMLYLQPTRPHTSDNPPMQPPQRSESPEALRSELNALHEADRITVSKFAPPGVLVNGELQVLQFRGPTGAYLEPPPGKASFDVLKMAREGLMLPLRSVINQARKTNKIARKEKVRFTQNGKACTVNLEVIPLKNLRERCFLIIFEEPRKTGHAARQVPARAPVSKKQERSRIADLETDLTETREYLQSFQEQHEAAIEELQAAHEEVQSANEELQSVNEELETSKEELESANEELTTVNEEMSHRNRELTQLNNDLLNLQASTRLTIILLGRDLVIRRFSAQAQAQFGLLPTDRGRPIRDIRHGFIEYRENIELPVDLESILVDVIASMHEQEREVRDRSGHWYLMRVRPYTTVDNKIDGAVLVLVDIDRLKHVEKTLIDARNYAESIIATVREPLLVLDKELRIESANQAFYDTFQVAPKETLGHFIYNLGNRQWDIPRLRESLQESLHKNTAMEAFLVEHCFESIGQRIMLLNARRIVGTDNKSERILLAIEDITERSQAENLLRETHAERMRNEDLTRFNRAAVGRELRMVELKKEVNELSRLLGRPEPYPLTSEHEGMNADEHTMQDQVGWDEKDGKS